MAHKVFDFSQDYRVILDYQYTDNTPELVEVRIYMTEFLITNSDNYDDCLPGQNGTFLYGYSNDLDPQTVIDVTTVISNFLDPLQYEIYGSVRFDTVLQEPIFLSDNLSFFNASVNSNLPDRNLGFSGSDRGSNVADMLRRFLSFKPICGTFILLNMKRNVHEEDLSDVIELLRKHRVYVFTVASMNMVNSEDTCNQLRAMSIGSNGLLSFDNDIDFIQINYDLIIHIADRNPYYVASAQVSGNGSVELPIFHKLSGSGYIFIGVNTQNHAGPITFQTGKVRFNGPTRSYNDDLLINAGTLITNYMAFDFSQDYKVTLDYQYADNDLQTMDIRIYVDVFLITFSDYYDDCLPGQNSTFIYGYSNDLDPQTVTNVTHEIVDYRTVLNKYVTYGSVRFDTVLQEPIFLSHNWSSFNASVYSNLPDKNLGFSDSDRGSNVADMLRGYLTSKPTCGTFILLNMKRNVHDEDLSDVIELLRKHRVYVYTVASNKTVNSEDTFKQLHALSAGSNGLLSYIDDSYFHYMFNELVNFIAYNNPYYVASAQVSGNGSVELPMFHKLSDLTEMGLSNIGVTPQDHAGPISNLYVNINFDGPTGSHPLYFQYRAGTFEFQSYLNVDFSQDYNVTLDYQYADNQIQTIDIRMYVPVPVNQWPPYPSN